MDTSAFEYAEDMRYVASFVLEHELVSSAAEGIAKQILTRGWASLSDRQKEVFELIAVPQATKKCSSCGVEVPYNELDIADGNLCSWCANVRYKSEKE